MFYARTFSKKTFEYNDFIRHHTTKNDFLYSQPIYKSVNMNAPKFRESWNILSLFLNSSGFHVCNNKNKRYVIICYYYILVRTIHHLYFWNNGGAVWRVVSNKCLSELQIRTRWIKSPLSVMSDTFNVLSSNTHNEHPLLREDMEDVPTHQQTGIKEPKYSLLLLVFTTQIYEC